MGREDVPEPSAKLVAMYHEIWTEVDANYRNKDPKGGLPLTPRDHLGWIRRFAADPQGCGNPLALP